MSAPQPHPALSNPQSAIRDPQSSIQLRTPHSALRGLSPLLLSITLACTATAEQIVIGQFFAASRLRDRTALQNVATVTFEPGVLGTISAFDIVGVAPDRRRPLSARTMAVEPERTVVDRSLDDGDTPLPDVAAYGGELVARDVTIAASVRPPRGPVVRRTLVITVERAILRGGAGVRGRWIVTKVVFAD